VAARRSGRWTRVSEPRLERAARRQARPAATGAQRGVRGVDFVPAGELVVVDIESSRHEPLARTVGEVDADHRIVAPVGDERADAAAIGQPRLPAVDRGDEAGEGEYPGGRRALRCERQRVAHHRAHREAAQHRARGRDAGALPQLVVERAQQHVGGVEGIRVGIADARHDIPVLARPAGDRQRRARRDDVQAPCRIERVGEPQQVVLIGAAPVVEHEQAARLARGGALAKGRRRGCLGHASAITRSAARSTRRSPGNG
jgi:hypothetical protein